MPKLDIMVTTITPVQAAKLLAKNQSNRKIRDTVVRKYASDMAAGRWQLGAGTIDFDSDGNLLNGQHRLAACVLADVPFETIVVHNVAAGTQTVMDIGAGRSLADLLHFRGEKNSAALSSAINTGWKWREGQLTQPTMPSRQQALDWLDHNPSIRDFIISTQPTRQALTIPASALTCFMHQANRIAPASAAEFFEALRTGANLDAGHPILVFRNYALNQAVHRNMHRASSVVFLAILVKAWNAWMLGNDVKQLAWRRGQKQREEFPEMLDAHGNPAPIVNEF